MRITVEEISENEDGSANAVINFDNEGLKYLIQYAVLDILTRYAEQHPIVQPEEKKAKKVNVPRKRKASTKT
jgi:hypothetical protein